MKEIKQKKERRFLKTLGRVGEILVEQVLLKLGSSLIKKIGGKKTLPSILFLFLSLSLFAQFPNTLNKQRLGFQTTGDGLVYRGRAADTVAIKSSGLNNAYFIFDTVNNIQYNYIKTKGGWVFSNGDTIIINGVTMPFDSITFNTAKNGTVGVGEVEYNDTQGSLIQGLKGGNVTNVIGQQLHQRVNNRTGAPLAKGDVVYLAGSQGNRITVAKGLAVTDAFSANTFGVVAEAIANNASGFIITEGLITGLNTSALTEDSAVYLSPTVAGALTSTKPQAPQHSVYIGVCVKSNNGSGELFVKIRNGLEMDELHDTRITNPVTGATLYYSGGLWRDTTAALLVSDTASMLTPYLRKADTASISNRINLKVNISDTLNMLVPYLRKADTTNMLLPYFRDADTTQLNLTSRFAAKQNTLNGTGFVKASGTNITYDNSSYLRTGLADSTYLKLTGGTLTGGLTGTTGTFLTNTSPQLILGINDNNSITKLSFNTGSIERWKIFSTSSISSITFESLAQTSAARGYRFISSYNTDSHLGLVQDPRGNVGIKSDATGNDVHPNTLYVNGTLGVTGATTLSNLAGTGTRMVVAASDGLLSTQALGVSTFSAGTTGFTPSTATSGAITLGGTLAIANGGTGATSAANARTNLGATTRGANTFLLTDIGAISFLRYNADNTVSQRAADGMRSDLGGTTIGQSMFTLTNPSAITFPRFNADNTVSALDAATFRTAIGAGTGNGNGTVTNVTGTLPISVATGTTTPSITIANASTTASGVVTTGTQSMAGNKTFTGDLATIGAFSATGFSTLTGGASVGTMATESTLTHVIGVNSSNAIGKLGLGVGMSVGSGILSVQAAGASQSGLVTSTTQTFGGTKTFNGTINAGSELAVTGISNLNGGATIGTMATTSSLTSLIGVNNSNSIGKITLGSGLSLSSGTLTATAGNDVNIYLAINGPGIILSSSFGVYSHWYVNINQSSTVSITLPSASGNPNKTLVIKNSGTGAVNSNATNVEPLNSTTLGTSILTSGGGKFATLVSNGTNWIIMQAN